MLVETKNGEGNILYILHILNHLYILHNQTPFVILFPKTYNMTGLSIVLAFVFVFVFVFVSVFIFSETLPVAYRIQNPFFISCSKTYHNIGVSGSPFICLCLCICVCICIFVRIWIANIMGFQKIYIYLRGP